MIGQIDDLHLRAEPLDEALASRVGLAERIAMLVRQTSGRLAFSTSLGLEDQAVLHAIAEVDQDHRIEIFTLDTGRHFPETLELLSRSEAHFDRRIRVFSPQGEASEALVARDGIMGFRLSVEARKACCAVRKVEPLTRALRGASVWITGLRRGQSQGRSQVPFAAWDGDHGLIKVNPISDWGLPQVEDYIAHNGIPVSPLHAKGFPSIGCQPCTRAIRPGEDIRAGRWWWENEDGRECGLHRSSARKPRVADEVTS